MPGLVGTGSRPAKRKTISSDKRPAKRAKSLSSDESEDPQVQILLLETEIFESKKKYNNIATLIRLLRTDGDTGEDSVLAAISLCRVFTRLMVSGELVRKQGAPEKDITVTDWLKERLKDYKSGLYNLLQQEDVSSTALTLCMRLLKTEGEHIRNGQDYRFPSEFLTEIIRILLKAEDPIDRKEFSEKFVEEYDDVRFYTLESIEKILSESQQEALDASLFDNALEILIAIESVPDSKDELEDFYIPAPKKSKHDLFSLTQHKRRAQGAWLVLMHMEMSKDQRKSILGIMADSIAPWFMKPELLMDFLTDSYNTGGSISLLALSGVFYLIQEKNLDYPSFYRKLYSLLDKEILHSKHRSKFFRLLDTFLASTHLPGALVASFVKRLARLTLQAPPSGIVTVVPWIYNILKKHPACTFMIHRKPRNVEEKDGMRDPFLMDEEDPMETRAIESSLWEIVTLQSHFHPNVATLANIISEQFTKHAYNIEDFLDHSYGSMLEAENSKEVKKIPVIEFDIPKRIFTEHAAAMAGLTNGLLVETIDFS